MGQLDRNDTPPLRPEFEDKKDRLKKGALEIKDRALVTAGFCNHNMALSPDNKRVLLTAPNCFSDDRNDEALWSSILVWDLKEDKLVRSLTGLAELASEVAFTANGSKAVAACWFQSVGPKKDRCSDVIIWDLSTGDEKKRFEIEGTAVAISQDGATLLTYTHWLRKFAVYDIADGCKKVLSMSADGSGSLHRLSPDGGLFAMNRAPDVVSIWDAAGGKEQASFRLGLRYSLANSVISIAWFTATSWKTCTSPLVGQRISRIATLSALPRPSVCCSGLAPKLLPDDTWRQTVSGLSPAVTALMRAPMAGRFVFLPTSFTVSQLLPWPGF